jgi:hypothetical protein
MVTSPLVSTAFFPDRSAFAGPVHELGPVPATAFAGQARFTGGVLATAVARAEAAAMLPPELELAPPANGTAAIHPLLVTFGDLDDGSFVFGGLPFEALPPYGELCVAIPFVRRRGGRSLHLWSARLFTTSWPSCWHGNATYGLRKAMATMRRDAPTLVVTAAEGAEVARAELRPGGEWHRTAPAFDAIRRAFALPVVGRRDDGTLVSSYFRWETDDVLVRPAEATVSLAAGAVDGLAAGPRRGARDATFAVRRMLWRVTWPMPSRL